MKELLVTLRDDGHSYLCYNYEGVCECDCQCDCDDCNVTGTCVCDNCFCECDCQCDRYCDDRCESCDSCVQAWGSTPAVSLHRW